MAEPETSDIRADDLQPGDIIHAWEGDGVTVSHATPRMVASVDPPSARGEVRVHFTSGGFGQLLADYRVTVTRIPEVSDG